MTNAIAQSIEKKGTFVIVGDIAGIRDEVKEWFRDYEIAFEEFEETERKSDATKPFSFSEDEQAEIDSLNLILNENDWEKELEELPRKKNGTFYKNRTIRLWAGHKFAYESQEEYGMRGPELRIKVHSDTEAELQFLSSTIIEKW